MFTELNRTVLVY